VWLTDAAEGKIPALMARVGEEFPFACPRCGGDIRLGGDRRQEPAHFEPEQLKALQRAGRRPSVESVKEKDVVAAFTHLRDLLQGDVGVAAQVLKALVGDVILESRQVAGQAKPQMVARFTINTLPALAALERGRPTDRDVAPAPVWGSIHPSPTDETATAGGPPEAVVPLTYDRREAARRLRKPQPRS